MCRTCSSQERLYYQNLLLHRKWKLIMIKRWNIQTIYMHSISTFERKVWCCYSKKTSVFNRLCKQGFTCNCFSFTWAWTHAVLRRLIPPLFLFPWNIIHCRLATLVCTRKHQRLIVKNWVIELHDLQEPKGTRGKYKISSLWYWKYSEESTAAAMS